MPRHTYLARASTRTMWQSKLAGEAQQGRRCRSPGEEEEPDDPGDGAAVPAVQ